MVPGTAGSEGSEMSLGHFSAPPLSGFGPHSFPADVFRFPGSKYGRQQLPRTCPPPAVDLKGQEEGRILLEPREHWCHGGETIPREPADVVQAQPCQEPRSEGEASGKR